MSRIFLHNVFSPHLVTWDLCTKETYCNVPVIPSTVFHYSPILKQFVIKDFWRIAVSHYLRDTDSVYMASEKSGSILLFRKNGVNKFYSAFQGQEYKFYVV